MSEYIFFFVVSTLIAGNVLFFWFNTELPMHLLSWMVYKRESERGSCSYDDLTSEIYSKNKFFGSLLSCRICFSGWVSGIVALIMVILNPSISAWFIPSCILGCPLVIHVITDII